MTLQDMVKEFHIRYAVKRAESLSLPEPFRMLGRIRLLQEELHELTKAFHDYQIDEVADALADLAYVVYGTADICGIKLDPVIAEVHRSNMTKSPGNFKPIKGPMYSPPDITKVLNEQ